MPKEKLSALMVSMLVVYSGLSSRTIRALAAGIKRPKSSTIWILRKVAQGFSRWEGKKKRDPLSIRPPPQAVRQAARDLADRGDAMRSARHER